MKLVSCYITGFGKFVDRSFDLSAPITVFKEENGWGKTTLAEFLESMFYGIDGGRSKIVSENARLKYEPWSGARFGGSLVFSYAGKTYRIERFFARTPSGDTVRVYDANNMLCYDFGDKAERVGETVFGLDRESYRKTAYLPQNIANCAAIPENIKGKLLALLSVTADQTGGQNALDRLEAADRALRAKRRPAKGKLDELDERLAYLNAQKTDCKNAADRLAETEREMEARTARLKGLSDEIARLAAKSEEYTRRSEMAAQRAVRAEIESKLSEAQTALAEWNAFFGENAPATLNTEGLEKAVNEFYEVKAQLLEKESAYAALSAQIRDKQTLETQRAATEKSLESYELLLNPPKKETPRVSKDKTKAKRGIKATFALVFMLALSIIGAMLVEGIPALGASLLAIGAAGVLVCFIVMLRSVDKPQKPKEEPKDPALVARYEAIKAELVEIDRKLALIAPQTETEFEELSAYLEEKRAHSQELDGAIQRFLSNFRFGEIYDYRAALGKLKDGVAAHEKYTQISREYTHKLSALTPVQNAQDSYRVLDEREIYPSDIEDIKTQIRYKEEEKENLTTMLGKAVAGAEQFQKRAAELTDYEAEESALLEEKARLEKRLTAIRYAKELLTRARANMATRYLDPVEQSLRVYAQTLGFNERAQGLQFAADGAPISDENGNLRSAEYFSAGMKDLLDFCVRIALAEAVFTKDAPPLILDDPFTNLDDEKTARAKALMKQLAQKYQIIYFTCKEERSL